MTFKGVLPMEIQLMLDHFIHVQCFFTLDMLNDRMASFCYGKSEKKNKPSRQLENKHIKGSTNFLCQVHVKCYCIITNTL